jgi:Ino eighty subunit 2
MIDGTDTYDEDGQLENRPPLGFIRIVHNSEGTTLAVPEEWLEAPVGELFVKTAKPVKPYPAFKGKMVEEID